MANTGNHAFILRSVRATVALLLLGMCTSADAGTIISTGLLGVNPDLDTFALRVTCTVVNASAKPVVVDSVRFLNDNGVDYPQNIASNCSYPNPIFPGLACKHFVSSTFR